MAWSDTEQLILSAAAANQRDLDKMGKGWAARNLMKFIKNKCQFLL